MDVITIESSAFAQIMAKLKSLEDKFIELRDKAENPLKDRWLDNQEMMQILKISRRTLQTYRDEKVIPFSQVGSKIYYKAADVEKFLKKNYKKISRF
jgi:DNA-directed RNA polymerase specialized sigma54-like protein